jgi:integral membrane protein (TIGR01906 family)
MKILQRIGGWVVILIVPVVLVLFGIGVLLSPIYIQVEYRMPYFPADGYGFTREERLYWADLSIDYLLNNEGIEFLSELKFPEGQQAAGSCEDFLPPRDCSYFYNDRELSHMVDVKVVLRYAIAVFIGSLVVLIGIGFWAKRLGWWPDFKKSLSYGGWLTVGLIAVLLMYVIINFRSLFVTFHEIFFASGTWVFRFSDSLIRLFPVTFWRDAFVWIGLISLVCGAALGYILGRKDSSS